MKNTVIIDFEFTGLDNSFVEDNEIVQLKFLDCETNHAEQFLFKTDKRSGAGAFICHRLDNKDCEIKFDSSFLRKIIEPYRDKTFVGFGVQQDLAMLRKYRSGFAIQDMKDSLILSEYEERLALEGNSLEACYYIVTGKTPEISNHGGLEELFLMKEILEKIKDLKLNKYLNFVPFGHCAGMPLRQYVVNYRRQADGYRYNNNDVFATSLSCEIDEMEYEEWEEEVEN